MSGVGCSHHKDQPQRGCSECGEAAYRSFAAPSGCAASHEESVKCNHCGKWASMCICDAPETVETLRSCRDHWKVSWEHERQNVIRLRELVYKFHGDAKIVQPREQAPSQSQPELKPKDAEEEGGSVPF